jgi:hypothetical protein
MYEDPQHEDFPKWLKTHQGLIRKLSGEEEDMYYQRIRAEVIRE